MDVALSRWSCPRSFSKPNEVRLSRDGEFPNRAVVWSRIPAMAMNILEGMAAGGVYVNHVAKDEDVLTGRFLVDKQL